MPLPIKGGKITTAYKKKGKHWSKGYHTGVDFAVPTGTPVLAVQDGKILPGGWGKAYGKQVLMSCEAGFVIYAHLSQVLVKPGDKVKAGDVIGKVGSTGNSTGPHLHLELRNQQRWTGGKDLDPAEILKG
jgi:murein DD-endopeptidase MepM/ murein hydrolase activator NlpD